MTLTIELSPQMEQQLRAIAAANGQEPSAYAVTLIERALERIDEANGSQANGSSLSPRQQAVQRLCGMLPSDGHAVDRFLAERHEEAEQEMRPAIRTS